jgi:hypothetical protein
MGKAKTVSMAALMAGLLGSSSAAWADGTVECNVGAGSLRLQLVLMRARQINLPRRSDLARRRRVNSPKPLVPTRLLKVGLARRSVMVEKPEALSQRRLVRTARRWGNMPLPTADPPLPGGLARLPSAALRSLAKLMEPLVATLPLDSPPMSMRATVFRQPQMAEIQLLLALPRSQRVLTPLPSGHKLDQPA